MLSVCVNVLLTLRFMLTRQCTCCTRVFCKQRQNELTVIVVKARTIKESEEKKIRQEVHLFKSLLVTIERNMPKGKRKHFSGAIV